MAAVQMLLNRYQTKKFLYGGEMILEQKPSLVWTVLGSCLAICFYHQRMKIGAIVHAQLPEKKMGPPLCDGACPVRCLNSENEDSPYKYVTCAFKNVLDQFRHKGMKTNELHIKLFGGASTIGSNGVNTPVGLQNIETAHALVDKHRLKLVSQHVGGDKGRKIFFLTDSGDVYLKMLQRRADLIDRSYSSILNSR